MLERGRFVRPARWAIGGGPEHLESVSQAESAVAAWLARMPDRLEHHEERERILALRQILRNSGPYPSPADLQSAKLAIKGFVQFARSQHEARPS